LSGEVAVDEASGKIAIAQTRGCHSLGGDPHLLIHRSALLINWDDRHSSQFATQEQIQGERDGDHHEK
jgi:hypothetical protein